MPIYERGPVRIHYEEMGSGFPLLVIPGGGLNSTIAGLDTSHPFNAMKECAKDGLRCIGPICATPILANRLDRWKSTGRGTRILTTISA
jgi:hypothetical protein